MEKVGRMWSTLKSRCQTLFHTEGGGRGEGGMEVPDVRCVVDPARGIRLGEPLGSRAVSPARSLARSLSPLPLVADHAPPPQALVLGRRGHNCVTDIPQILEITIDAKDGEDARGPGGGAAPLARRDSYSRHAPWGGKKKHSCSTKTQSSLEATDKRLGRIRVGGGGGLPRRERRYGNGHAHEAEPCAAGRSLRQRIHDTVGLCLPLRPRPPRPSKALFASKRKIHLTELMLETCPFPPGSDLAHKWHLIKQHTAPVSPQSSGTLLDAFDPARPSPEDEEERLRERRRLSIEEGVDPPPNAQIHTFEATAQITSLYKLGPKMAPGMGEGSGEGKGGAGGGGLGGGGVVSAGVALVAAAAAAAPMPVDCDSEEDSTTLCLQSRRPKQRHTSGGDAHAHASRQGPWKVHTQIDYIHCLVPDLLQISGLPCYWGVMDRYEAEALLEGRPEGTFLLRDSAQEDYLFSVSFRRYNRSLHARIEQWNHNFSFDAHDPCVFHASTVTGLLEHYKDPSSCMFFEPLLTAPLHRTFPFSLQRLARAAICRRTTYDGIGGLPLPSALQDFLKEYHYKQKVRVRWLEREPLKIK